MRVKRDRLPLVLANLGGLAAFVWPLLAAPAQTASEGRAHATDAPILIALLVPLLVLAALAETRSGGDARVVALLGALTAVNAVLRLPKGPTGEGFVFVLPILAGWYVGGRFAYLLGAFTMVTSAVLTGGAGPWMPFQMLALGWVGAGAAVARRVTGGRAPAITLACYAWASSIAYGFLMTLWFWPFLGGRGDTFFAPGLGLDTTLARYVRFYVLTSLPWDTGRALLTNAPLVAILARPVGTLLERAGRRFRPVIRCGTSDTTTDRARPAAEPDRPASPATAGRGS